MRIPTGSEAEAFDHHAITGVGVPQLVLMENAGRSAAQVVQRLYPEGRVVGLVGSGNNGGDALVLLRTLAAWGREVTAVLTSDRPKDDPLLHGWTFPTTTLEDDAWRMQVGSADVLVDGMLGTGVRGAPREPQASVIEEVNGARAVRVALDIPSGVDAGTGAVPGLGIRADVTVAFGAPKLGTLLHPGRAHAGRLVAVEIGFPPPGGMPASARAITPAWGWRHAPRRALDTHKNEVGRVLVVAGHAGMAGAAVLAVEAALRTGAGLVQVASPGANRQILQGAVPEAIFVDTDEPGALERAIQETHVVAVGPGLGTGEGSRAILDRVLTGPDRPTVLDADALNLLAGGDAEVIRAVTERRPVLMTPHPGEMGRLLGDALPPDASRAMVAGAAAERFRCTVLFKGAPSLVAWPGSPLLVDTQGSSDLATAGLGDVLTGVCAALMAQGLPPGEAAGVGLYRTGRAAVLAGKGTGLTPRDVVRWIPDATREEPSRSSDLDLPFVTFDLPAAR